MADRALPFGQVTPVARPIGAFVQAAQSNAAAPARPTELPASRGISTLQQGGTTNVGGYNQFEQLATALAPFSKALIDTAAYGIQKYATGKIEEGYYQELKNQQAKAMLSLQVQAETGAADAASQIGQLQKVDPPAAELLREANPWKLIGRRRALAQLAGSRVEDVLAADLETNAGELARLKPGSPELKARQVQLTSEVLNKFQLTGDEPEVNFYVTPKINEAWEKYSNQQRKFYNSAVEESTKNATTASMAALMQQVLTTAATVQGQTYAIGTPEWRAYGAATLTVAMDQQLKLLDPEARSRVVKYIREQIGGTYGNTPQGAQLLQEIRGGDPSMPYEKRPTWGAMAPLDMLELQVRGGKAVQEQHDLQQQTIETRLDALWYGTPEKKGPGSIDPTDPSYPAALLKFRNQAVGMGYVSPEEYISKRAKDQSAFVQVVRPPDPFEEQDFATRIEQAGPSIWTDDPNAYTNALKAARDIAKRQPTPELQKETYDRLVGTINKARTAAGEFDAGVRDRVQNEVLQDLDSATVRQIRDKQKVNGQQGDALAQALASRMGGGASVSAAVAATYQNTKLTAATNQLQAMYERSLSTAIRQWQGAHPGQVMSPSARSVVMSEAAVAARKSPEYARIIKELTGRNPGEVGPGQRGAAPQQGRGVPRGAAGKLPDSTVKAYATRAVMEPKWVYSELQALQKGKPVSKEIQDLARRAGIPPLRYLQEQLRFYPQLDPDGSVRRWLQEKTRQQQSNRAVGGNLLGAVLPSGLGGFNPLAAGGWLMGMLTPPAAAATLELAPRMPSSGLYGGTGGGGGGRWSAATSNGQALVRVASRLGLNPADLAAVFSFETGGTLSPAEPGRGAAAGRVGLIQAGPNEMRQYGIHAGQSFAQQLEGVARYLTDRGVKPGMGLADIYAAVNGGNVRAGWSADGNGVVARSETTLRELRRHRQQAMARLGLSEGSGGFNDGSLALLSPRGVRPEEIGSRFGNRESFRRKAHEGDDIRVEAGTPLGLAVGGTVVRLARTNSRSPEANGGYGNYMDIRLANGSVIRMAHLSQIPSYIRQGGAISPNQVIAYSGGGKGEVGSGRSTGPHLHFEHLSRPMGTAETTRGKQDPTRSGAVSLLRIGRRNS